MKKILILPVAMAVLSACSSNQPAPVENGVGVLSPTGSQPVYVTGENANWQPQVIETTPVEVIDTNNTRTTAVNQIQHTTQNFYIPRDPRTNKPIYSKIKKGSYNGSTYQVQKGDSLFLIAYLSGESVDAIAKRNHLKKPYALSVGQTIKLSPKAQAQTYQQTIKQNVTQKVAPVVSQNFQIPRDPQTHAPEYNKIQKGFYTNQNYVVRPGDTMYLIAYIAGLDVQQLAALNNLSEPYDLAVGQVLKVNPNARVTNNAVVTTTPVITTSTAPTTPVKVEKIKNTTITTTHQPSKKMGYVVWQWPTTGTVSKSFSKGDNGNKGIDIAGTLGQTVRAAAAGQVVYAGNALRGYGNLIIIKHNNDYLSAYAHNDTILVKDKQYVKAGQQIAKMGRSGTDRVKLHFEIRHKGQSVDPKLYLPKK